ncbi:MAG: UDP-2,3-diacylglucosamine diphosphatase [Saprospiraceae bacterium]
MSKKKIYFASDFHLGAKGKYSSKDRERQIVRWLDQIKTDAEAIYLVGDVFDFWFEYNTVVPKGYTRLLGKLAELSDSGIPIFFFIGNHDMWMFKYFEEELGIKTFREPIQVELKGKSFYIGHGDGLGPGDHKYKVLKKVFANPICQFLFGWIHPNIGIGLADFWSNKSRDTQPAETDFLGEENEWLLVYANEQVEKTNADFFIFGHRHLPIDYMLKNGHSRYINLGEWMNYNSYAVYDGENLSIEFFENDEGKITTGP